MGSSGSEPSLTETTSESGVPFGSFRGLLDLRLEISCTEVKGGSSLTVKSGAVVAIESFELCRDLCFAVRLTSASPKLERCKKSINGVVAWRLLLEPDCVAPKSGFMVVGVRNDDDRS